MRTSTNRRRGLLPLLCTLVITATPALADDARIERGRYVIAIAGCNDCHTRGYPEAGGRIPESQWLTGHDVGFSGPWGTTYPSNLRARLAEMSEDTWVAYARALQTRPPMPWFSLNAMSDEDLRAVHAFIRHLGPTDDRVPAYTGPGEPPTTPVIAFPAEASIAGE